MKKIVKMYYKRKKINTCEGIILTEIKSLQISS